MPNSCARAPLFLLAAAALLRADWELTSFHSYQDDIFSINEQKGVIFIGYEKNLILSKDQGATWQAGQPGLNTKVTELEPMGDTMFAATLDRGLQFSLDGGQAWKPVAGLGQGKIQCMTEYQGVLYVGTGAAGIFRSRDAGRTWQAVNTGLPDMNVLALTGGAGCLFAGDNSKGVFRSTDQGDHWTGVNKGFNGNGCFFLAWDGKILFATPKDHKGTIRSSDLGDTWDTTINGQGPPYYPHSLKAYGPNVFQMIANNGGVHVTKDGGKTWMYINPQPKKPIQPRYIGMAGGYIFVMDYQKGIWRRAASEVPLAPIPSTASTNRPVASRRPIAAPAFCLDGRMRIGACIVF